MTDTRIERNPWKLALLLVIWFAQLPLLILFYFIRSAWQDSGVASWAVGRFLAPRRICEHGVDVVREHCESCCLLDQQEEEARYRAAMKGMKEN